LGPTDASRSDCHNRPQLRASWVFESPPGPKYLPSKPGQTSPRARLLLAGHLVGVSHRRDQRLP
jgi:hypothetical protein